MEKHSNLLKRFASGKLNLFSALKILKVLLKDIEDENLISWVEREMNGYDVSDPDIPSYRKAKGCIMGNVQTANSVIYDQPLPTRLVPKEHLESLTTVIISDGVVALKNIVQRQEGVLARPVQVECYPWFNNALNRCSVTQINVRVDHSIPANVLSNIENKVLDIFYLLEQKGCNIDEMDVSEIKSQQPNIVTLIKELVYADNRITIGDGNEFAKTTLQTHGKS